MKVTENIELRGLNSFGVEARAARLVEWSDARELAEVDFSGRWMALGGGCNVLFVKDFDGTIVKSVASAITIEGETADRLLIRADAGVVWDDLVRLCVERGVWGAENLSAIPGTVGAAPIQNIGAYGAEAADIIVAVDYFDTAAREVRTMRADGCRFGYRESVFKRELRGRAVVTSVLFALSKVPRPNIGYAGLAARLGVENVRETGSGNGNVAAQSRGNVAAKGENAPHPTLADIRRAVMETRAEKLPDPHVTGNAGSFFKNPVVAAVVADALTARYPDMPHWAMESVDTKANTCSNAAAAKTDAGSDSAGVKASAKTGAGTSTDGVNVKTGTLAPQVKLSAGWLIEKAGWKGRTEGRVGIHPRQALIVVNTGGATGAEIVEFAQRLAADVREKFGVELTPEVQIIG